MSALYIKTEDKLAWDRASEILDDSGIVGLISEEQERVLKVKLAYAFHEICSQAWLGNATTKELYEELMARAEVGGYINYKPVDQTSEGFKTK